MVLSKRAVTQRAVLKQTRAVLTFSLQRLSISAKGFERATPPPFSWTAYDNFLRCDVVNRDRGAKQSGVHHYAAACGVWGPW